MMRIVFVAVFAAWVSASSVGRSADYAIVVSQATYQDADWRPVVDALADKHGTQEIVQWDDKVSDALASLRERHPRYTCFVAKPTEAGRQFVADVHRLTRAYDEDPYTDSLWGILTGYDAANALSIAQETEPLTIRKVAAGTEVALEMCHQGIWYDELVQHKQVLRPPGEPIQTRQGPADTTRLISDSLAADAADLFVSSGHATERDWQIGFAYRNGSFRSQSGQMFGVTSAGERFEVNSPNPKVFLPVGNCLMGHIDGPDAMALAWLHSVGVRQMIGYTVVTWYGYGGWGVLDYFVEQPGRYTLAEAFHANHHALIHRLEVGFDGDGQTPSAAGAAIGLTSQDARGLLWDRDVVAFYGDPAWVARMEAQPTAFEQKLSIDGQRYRLTITPNRGEESFQPINENGSQRGWRPFVAWLPHRVRDVQVTRGSDLNPVITDDFILVPNPRACDPSRTYEIEFTAVPRSQ